MFQLVHFEIRRKGTSNNTRANLDECCYYGERKENYCIPGDKERNKKKMEKRREEKRRETKGGAVLSAK